MYENFLILIHSEIFSITDRQKFLIYSGRYFLCMKIFAIFTLRNREIFVDQWSKLKISINEISLYEISKNIQRDLILYENEKFSKIKIR